MADEELGRAAIGRAGLAIAALVLGVGVALDGRADIDPSFSQDGRVTIDARGYESARGPAVQPAGKILVAGSYGFARSSGRVVDGAVYRLNVDGSFDTGFGVGGVPPRADTRYAPETAL